MTADGRRIPVEFTITMLKDVDGRVEGVAAILRDVTAQELRNLRRQLAFPSLSADGDSSGA